MFWLKESLNYTRLLFFCFCEGFRNFFLTQNNCRDERRKQNENKSGGIEKIKK